jgi:hypothetical protein
LRRVHGVVSQETSQKRVLENQESFAHVSSHCEIREAERSEESLNVRRLVIVGNLQSWEDW